MIRGSPDDDSHMWKHKTQYREREVPATYGEWGSPTCPASGRRSVLALRSEGSAFPGSLRSRNVRRWPAVGRDCSKFRSPRPWRRSPLWPPGERSSPSQRRKRPCEQVIVSTYKRIVYLKVRAKSWNCRTGASGLGHQQLPRVGGQPGNCGQSCWFGESRRSAALSEEYVDFTAISAGIFTKNRLSNIITWVFSYLNFC